MCIIFSIYLLGILLLVLIFSYIDFRQSTINASCFVIFACYMSIEGQVVAIVAQIVPTTNLALYKDVVYFGCKKAANQLLELFGGF